MMTIVELKDKCIKIAETYDVSDIEVLGYVLNIFPIHTMHSHATDNNVILKDMNVLRGYFSSLDSLKSEIAQSLIDAGDTAIPGLKVLLADRIEEIQKVKL